MSESIFEWLKFRPLKPCPKCGKSVKAQWISGMGEKLVTEFGHPFLGKAGWYIVCDCGTMFEPLGYPTTASRQKTVLRRLERRWNQEASQRDEACDHEWVYDGSQFDTTYLRCHLCGAIRIAMPGEKASLVTKELLIRHDGKDGDV